MVSEFLSVMPIELNLRLESSRRCWRIGLTGEILGLVNIPAKTEVLKARRPDELNRLKPWWQKTCSQIHHKLSPRCGKLQCKHGIRSRLGLSFFTPPSQKKTADLARTDRKSVWNERSDHEDGRETSTPRRGRQKVAMKLRTGMGENRFGRWWEVNEETPARATRVGEQRVEHERREIRLCS